MTTESSTTDMSKWLAKTIAAILSSPHFSTPSHIGSLHLGPGPIDLFGTRFANTFTQDLSATVSGEEVTRDKFEQSLLSLQKHWSTNAQFSDPLQPPGNNLISTACSWVPPSSDTASTCKEVEILISAKTVESGGNLMINWIDIAGDSWLFA